MSVKIVPMTADHLEELEKLERICFSRPWSRKMLAEELENQCAAFLVAEDSVSGRVLGYAGLMVVADEGYITNVAVFPEYRRQGIASLVYRWWLDGGRNLITGVRQSPASHALWHSLAADYPLYYVQFHDKRLRVLGRQVSSTMR